MEISPAFLEFKSPFSSPSTQILTLTNTSDKVLAFKVKTTAPKVYCVRPNAAIVQPGESLDVSIILQGLKEEPKPDYKCKDKFLVVTLPCPYDLDEAKQTISQLWPTLEKQYKEQSVSKKIRVVFKISETKTQSIDESIPVPAPAKSEPAPVEKQIPTSEKSENVKFEKVESTTDSTSSPAISAENTSSSLNTVVISLLVALIAFLFWLLF